MLNQLLQIDLRFIDYKFGILAFVTAFVVAMIVMPPLIKLINRFKLFDVPDLRKEHSTPIPTMGGIASCAGMMVGCMLWFHFTRDNFIISLFFSIGVLFVIGVMDDLKNLSARYKLGIQLAVAFLIAFSGVRITSFNGLFGIYDLPVSAQYTFTVLAIAGITNAFNLIDGIDGLAGGLGFMSLVMLGLFLTLSGDLNIAVIAFALGGGLLGFLYYNFNPARIFMGDTGSLVLGFVASVLTIRLIQLNTGHHVAILPHVPVFAMSIVAIPVFDTLRVFGLRIWFGKSPFAPDKNHIHHLLTNNGWSHSTAAKMICGVHAIVLVIGYFLKDVSQLAGFAIILVVLLAMVVVFQRIRPARQLNSPKGELRVF
ncbi:MAG: glycosyltransferase family 4 protein [Flavisolibacter sp.]|jgi:UDP-GlcNAc:undecaprenyl-phosphate GlcNAc-1-phosphate transferase